MTQTQLAIQLGVCKASITQSVRRLGLKPSYGPIMGANRAARLTPEEVKAIRADITARRNRQPA